MSALDVRLRLSADGAELSSAAKQGEQALDGLEKRVARVGLSARESANAMRMVPMQITDIVTSLASGQAPMQVFIQQGGQLKDQFGGIAPAVRAVGSYVAGLVNPFTVAAAAAGLLATAYFKGAAEAEAYNRALILTGNVAGQTSAQLGAMAARLSATAGTQREHAAAIAELAGSSKIGAANLELLAAVAVQMERTVGQAVADTRAEFEALAKSPVDAVLKLNDQYQFLTAAVYRQIQALQDQGRQLEAGELAQRTYALAMEQRTKQLEANTGLIERAWRGVTGAAKSAWDAMLGIGREASLDQKIKDLDAKIAAASGTKDRFSGAGLLGMAVGAYQDKEIAALQQARDLLAENVRLQNRAAAAQGERVAQQQAELAWSQRVYKTRSDERKLEDEIKAIRAEGARAKASERQIEEQIAIAKEAYAKKSGAAAAAAAAARKAESDALQAAQQVGRSYQQVVSSLLDAQRKYTDATDDATDAQRILNKAQVDGTLAALPESMRAAIEALAQRTDEVQRLAAAEKQRMQELAASIGREVDRTEATADATEALRRELAEQERATAAIGATAYELQQVALREIDLRIVRVEAEAALRGESAAYTEQIRLLKQLREEKVRTYDRSVVAAADESSRKAADAYTAEMQRGADDSARAITDSIMRSTEQGRDLLDSMWKAFAGTVRSTVLRPYVQMGANAVVGALGLPGSGAASGLSAASGSGLLGSFLPSGGIGGIANAFATSSVGSALGLSSTAALPVEAAMYTAAPGLTSAGSALVSAAPYLAAALIAYQLFAKKGGGPKQGGSWSTTGERLFTPSTADALLGGVGSGILDQVGSLASRYGGSLNGATVSLGYDQDPIGTAGSRIASRVVGADGRVILDNSAGRDVGRDQDKFEAELQVEAQRVLLAALQASDLENGFADIFGRLDPATAAPEAVTNILALADTLYQMGEAAKGLPGAMGQVATLSATAREQLVGLAGGVQALTAAQQTFYSEFLTSSERYAIDTQRIGEAFARAVGQPIEALTAGRNADQIRETFKDLVLGIDLTSDAGIAAYAALTGMSGALSQWIDDSVELGRVASGASEAVEDLAASVESSFGDVQAAMREIAPAAETLVDAWRRGKSEIESIRAALGLDGGTSGSASLIAQMQRYGTLASGYGSARTTLQGSIFETGLAAMSPAEQAAALRQRAAGVWGTLQGSDDPAAVIGQYTDLILRAIRADGAASMAGQQAIYDAEYQGALDAQRLAKEARQDQVAVLTAQREAWEDQIDALERMRDFSREMRDYVTDLRIGDLSILSPTDRIGVAGAAFRTNLAGARAGDEASQRELTSSATAYLTETRKFFASSAEYVKVFQEVTGALDSLGLASARPEDQISLLREQITTAETQIERLKVIEDQQIELRKATIDTSAAEIEALRAIDSAAAAAQAYLLTEIQKQRSDLADHLETLQTIVDQQQAQIAQQAAIQAALQEQLDGIRSNTGATAAAVAASRSAPVAVG